MAALRLSERWTLRVDGRLLWADALRLVDATALGEPLGFGGAKFLATLLCVAPQMPAVRCMLPTALLAGATPPAPQLLLIRMLGDAAAVRAGAGGPVGSGKTALVERLCRQLRGVHDIAAVIQRQGGLVPPAPAA